MSEYLITSLAVNLCSPSSSQRNRLKSYSTSDPSPPKDCVTGQVNTRDFLETVIHIICWHRLKYSVWPGHERSKQQEGD